MSDNAEMKPFWMVYGIGQGCPTVRHETEIKAQREADRLASLHPGTIFVLLQATKAVRKREFDRFDLTVPPRRSGSKPDYSIDDDIPF